MRKEIHTGTLPMGQLPPLDDADLAGGERDPESIIVAENPIHGDEIAQLAFMEELVTIRLEPSSEKNASRFVEVFVNGRLQLIETATPQTVKRKYVEVLALATPIDIQTQAGSTSDENPMNKVIRLRRCKYPFSVVEDRNPRGAAWLTNLLHAAV